MSVSKAEFIKSSPGISSCPKVDKPEYAFIGRSNVGKSSLINMLTKRKELAKTSGKPGKTQLINHFLINEQWYLVDLPGYGWAKVSKESRKNWQNMIHDYILKRDSLINLFVLIDSRHDAQKIDLDFIDWLGKKHIPFALVFTKADKLSKGKVTSHVQKFLNVLRKTWEEMPPYFITSSSEGTGRIELLGYIESINDGIKKN